MVIDTIIEKKICGGYAQIAILKPKHIVVKTIINLVEVDSCSLLDLGPYSNKTKNHARTWVGTPHKSQYPETTVNLDLALEEGLISDVVKDIIFI